MQVNTFIFYVKYFRPRFFWVFSFCFLLLLLLLHTTHFKNVAVMQISIKQQPQHFYQPTFTLILKCKCSHNSVAANGQSWHSTWPPFCHSLRRFIQLVDCVYVCVWCGLLWCVVAVATGNLPYVAYVWYLEAHFWTNPFCDKKGKQTTRRALTLFKLVALTISAIIIALNFGPKGWL